MNRKNKNNYYSVKKIQISTMKNLLKVDNYDIDFIFCLV